MWKWILENLSNIDMILNIVSTIFGGVMLIGGGIIGFGVSVLKLKLKYSQYHYLNLVVDNQVKQAMKYYIPTRGQNIDPCTEEEYSTRHSFVSVELVKLFTKEIFKSSETQYFIILADSGMGKTTFLLKLFFEYYKKLFRKYDIVFVPLSLESTLDRIREVKNKSNSILLLDGFDEDKYAMEDYSSRLKIICNETELFYKVIMTCRTQFFPDRESEPKFTGKIKFGVGNKNVEFIKYYITPFSDKDTKKYLKKKYKSFFKRRSRIEAEKLIQRCPRLMMRPMLLNYIEYLINDDQNYEYTYQIYEALIEKWIERETIPNDILYSFTNKLALLMFAENRTLRPNYEFEKMCKDFDLKLNPIEAKSRSLLNRTAEGFYKFAHKSIYEYILAQNAMKDLEFRKKLTESNFVGLDMANLFFNEMCLSYIKKGKYSDLSYMRLSNCTFDNFNFSGCKLENCIFLKCEILNCIFDFTLSNGIEFLNCKLGDCNFNEANLCKAIFSGSTIKNCKFIESNLTESDFTNTTDGYTKIGWECDFKNALLTRANFSGLNLKEFTCIKDAKLLGINMLGAQLIDVDFLCGKDLSSAILKNSKLINCRMDDVVLEDSDIANAYVKNVTFSNSVFTDSNLVNSTFIEANFVEAKMIDANLKHSKFIECTFNKIDFRYADMSECKLIKSTLSMNIYTELKIKFLTLDHCNLDEKAQEFFDDKIEKYKNEIEEKAKLRRINQFS